MLTTINLTFPTHIHADIYTVRVCVCVCVWSPHQQQHHRTLEMHVLRPHLRLEAENQGRGSPRNVF